MIAYIPVERIRPVLKSIALRFPVLSPVLVHQAALSPAGQAVDLAGGKPHDTGTLFYSEGLVKPEQVNPPVSPENSSCIRFTCTRISCQGERLTLTISYRWVYRYRKNPTNDAQQIGCHHYYRNVLPSEKGDGYSLLNTGHGIIPPVIRLG